MGQSEVARLRRQIEDEYQAMKLGLSGFSWGTAKHDFIQARMRRVDLYHEQLARQVGEKEATSTIYDLYTQIIG
ncbi:hypothetical protein EI42_01469 [Thermosporothrix hazakensis]|jgi:hypothetical protein|uniref:Uncharacterized protein n=2 Tax=Thermosporothrix TaxID=768650 RepID=A0A326UDW0_THEHA|nr:hypothetical protein [Thermosporothrix hazakensis]PZW32924.1 hypothetical protein EI42_01469 [Thermosporothrix hazakensis]BBH90906.1 hypothetical protein KTC_56570 [Thermosporothrix sp. COM3]GCE48956.1 hypothetical protein KTH_38250 [Thermosporothrix hazakensis]